MQPVAAASSLRFASAARWRVADASRARRLASIRTCEYRESMARETCPAMLMMISSPAPRRFNRFLGLWCPWPDRADGKPREETTGRTGR